MNRILVAALGAGLSLLYVWLDDPFGRPRTAGSPPRLEEAPPPPALFERVSPQIPAAPADSSRAGAPPATPAAPAFLDGRVADVAQQPVRGAHVALLAGGEEEAPRVDTLQELLHRIVPPPAPLLEATAAEDGTFRLLAPGPGRYRLVTEARGFARDVLGGIELTAETPGGQLDIVLQPGVELRGRVVTPEGAAVPRAVVLARAEATAADPAVEVAVVADSLGCHDFPSLPAGREWTLLARAEGHVVAALADVLLPQTHLDLIVSRGQAYRVRVIDAGLLEPLAAQVLVRQGEAPVAAGETDAQGEFGFRAVPGRRVTLHVAAEDRAAACVVRALPPAGGPLDDVLLDVGGVLTGVVVEEETQRGLPGAGVRAESREHAGILLPRWLEAGEHGIFVYRGYDGRGLLLAAFAEGYVPGGEADSVLVEGWPATDFPVVLARAGWIEGWVRGPGGRGVEDATVRIVLAGGLVEGAVRTRPDGGFLLAGAPVRRPLRVVAWHPDLGYAVSETLRLEGSTVRGHADLQLTGQSPLRGHVVDELGGGLAGARVLVETVESAPLLVAETVTGRSGRFVLDGLACGRIRVLARRAGCVDAAAEFASIGGAFPEVELTLRAAVPIAGTVFHADRRAAAGVVVRAWAEGGERSVGWGLTGLDGRFTVAGVGAGRYRLEAASRGESAAMEVIVPAQPHVTLVLTPRAAPGRAAGDER
ncbi:MAG: carboxypeptidase regulatory-like domain-containing protein [Planctomycetes bacterium]|nr:carboxypeptidase regulatory-like domain-containing protein [Planctomycetota bacterium]